MAARQLEIGHDRPGEGQPAQRPPGQAAAPRRQMDVAEAEQDRLGARILREAARAAEAVMHMQMAGQRRELGQLLHHLEAALASVQEGMAEIDAGADIGVVDRRDLRSYRVAEDGSLVDGEVLFSLPEGEKGGWDGLTIDAHGNIFACNWRGGVFVVAPDGTWLGTIRTGGKNANCAFGGEDLGTLFITAGKRLVRVQTKTHGAPHPAQR